MSDYSKLMESRAARKRRHFSIGVICFTAFILVLSMSVVMTSAKPYLDLVSFANHSLSKLVGLYCYS